MQRTQKVEKNTEDRTINQYIRPHY